MLACSEFNPWAFEKSVSQCFLYAGLLALLHLHLHEEDGAFSSPQRLLFFLYAWGDCKFWGWLLKPLSFFFFSPPWWRRMFSIWPPELPFSNRPSFLQHRSFVEKVLVTSFLSMSLFSVPAACFLGIFKVLTFGEVQLDTHSFSID